jgi:hypothetical protein
MFIDISDYDDDVPGQQQQPQKQQQKQQQQQKQPHDLHTNFWRSSGRCTSRQFNGLTI